MEEQEETFVTCDFCEYTCRATTVCEECVLKFCDVCFETLHPMRGPLYDHRIIKASVNIQEVRCPDHGSKCEHFCTRCKTKLCSFCLLGTEEKPFACHMFHKIITLSMHVEDQKNRLLSAIEKTSNILGTIDHIESAVDMKQLELEFAWLARKEEIRQEFASLYDTLAERERDLLENLEKEVTEAMSSLCQLKETKSKLEAEETVIADECIRLVQDRCQTRFLKENDQMVKRCECLMESVRLLPGVDEHWPTFLKIPFSLYEEKLHLDTCLRVDCLRKFSVSVKEKILYIHKHDMDRGIRCCDLLVAPKLPPSTVCSYNVEIKSDSRSQGTSYTSLSLMSYICNAVGRLHLQPSRRYVVKIVPVYTCTGNRGREYMVEGPATFVIFVTEHEELKLKMFQDSGVQGYPNDVIVDTCIDLGSERFQTKSDFLGSYSFEEDRFQHLQNSLHVEHCTSGRRGQLEPFIQHFQTTECFLSGEKSFEEGRYEYQSFNSIQESPEGGDDESSHCFHSSSNASDRSRSARKVKPKVRKIVNSRIREITHEDKSESE